MATVTAAMHEIVRALIVLTMVVFLLGTPAALTAATPSLAQQAGALSSGQALCGHGQTPVACHAPSACCRPDLPLEPPRRLAPVPPAAGFATVAYASFRDTAVGASLFAAFHPRAPPA